MAIRITGMYSGLDTESIISELASAQSAKKNSLVKAQTKLSWKQDAWKALNTKIYSFYTNVLTNMNLEGAYKKKTTKISNDKYVNVVTSNESVNGVQNMKIDKMAKAGYLTGGVLEGKDGKKLSANSTLADLAGLNFSGGEGSFSVTVGGESTTIKVNGDTKISEVVKQLQSAGVNANFDAKNQRLFVSSKDTGELADFTLTGGDANGMQALSKLGLITEKDLLSDEYTKWANYTYKDDGNNVVKTQAYLDLIDAELAKRANAYKAQNDSLTKENEELQAKLDEIKKDPGFPKGESAADLYEKLYGPEHEVQKQDEEGNPVVDEHNNPVYEKVRDGGLKADLDSKKEALEEAKKNGGDVAAAQQAVDLAQAEFDKVNGNYSMAKAAKDYQDQIDNNNATINDNKNYFTATPAADGKTTVEGTADLRTVVETEFDAKVATAKEVVAEIEAKKNQADKSGGYYGMISDTATRVVGEDAKIYLNGAEFTSDTNTFEVNGLTISVLGETDEEITLSTGDDVDGMYDMIKNFIVEYNKLINEMDSLYNAASSKGYEPLLTEEKDALTDSEVEEWEKKIKDSLLRRDSTLSGVSGAMKTAMMQGIEVNGKKMYLADFGIETLGYFKSADNEKNAYHINGDEDETDSGIRAKDNDLKSMIASDPDTVMKFFSGLSKNLYAELDKKMARSESSSAFTVYNDKDMKEEYDSYKEKISKQEAKLNDLIDKWYKKFSVMETAMAKLQSKNNAVAGMFGG